MTDLLIALAISAARLGLFGGSRRRMEKFVTDIEQASALYSPDEAADYADYIAAKHAEAEERARELIA